MSNKEAIVNIIKELEGEKIVFTDAALNTVDLVMDIDAVSAIRIITESPEGESTHKEFIFKVSPNFSEGISMSVNKIGEEGSSLFTMRSLKHD